MIPAMVRWNINSNVADVLSLGPRVAGRLSQVGVRTAAEMLAVDAAVLASRLNAPQFSCEQLTCWQHETRLLLVAPQFSCETVRLLVALGWARLENIARVTPTELLAEIENKKQEKNCPTWLANERPHRVAEVSDWIREAQAAMVDKAA